MFKCFVSMLALTVATLSTAAAETHLGQTNISSHVTLSMEYGAVANTCSVASFPAAYNLYRVISNGDRETVPFQVPAGRYLVVTDVTWSAQGLGGKFWAAQTLRLDVKLRKPRESWGRVVYQSPPEAVPSDLVGALLGASDHLTAGFVIGPGVAICPDAYQQSQSGLSEALLRSFVISGYLTP